MTTREFFRGYRKDRGILALLSLVTAGVFFILLWLFHAPRTLIVMLLFVFFLYVCTAFFYEFARRHHFYDALFSYMKELDQKNLLVETLPDPIRETNFFEGTLVLDLLYEIGRSATEQISDERHISEAFREYIELWVHEIKLPLSRMTLALHNMRVSDLQPLSASLRRTDEIVDTVLFYARSETPEKDFLIKSVPLRKVVSETAVKYREDLTLAGISFSADVSDETVLTDEKWLLFLLGQLISNAVKYRNVTDENGGQNEDYPAIEITAKSAQTRTTLTVRDNGIGIPKTDLPRVTEKSFTGENGRRVQKSTGMGLYLVKKLCDKLGHGLVIESEAGEYTAVSIVFGESEFTEIAR